MEEKDHDGALAAKAKEGDRAAWETLYRRAYPRLMAYARRRLDPEGARDAVSETMARAVSGIDRFTPDVGFDAWLFGILRHVVIDMQRAQAVRAEPRALEPPEAPPGPLESLLGAEEAAALVAAFRRLSDEDRELLELRVVAGLTSDQAASVLGKRPGAVRMAQARAIERLRALMEQTEGAR